MPGNPDNSRPSLEDAPVPSGPARPDGKFSVITNQFSKTPLRVTYDEGDGARWTTNANPDWPNGEPAVINEGEY